MNQQQNKKNDTILGIVAIVTFVAFLHCLYSHFGKGEGKIVLVSEIVFIVGFITTVILLIKQLKNNKKLKK